ncbi:PQQ-like beta-propeller repeat protein [Microbacterium sp. W1N]|uniref:PQQ-like beta-propeller repeat protein n=1 Tax=Microbacterium festucae TaxID=2977531 RepID=UPI0021C157DA|nr:PQQ-like beta-propeller repeat protein [Microbacterium festucae]MCT9819136.1 PQQ-like beta-propeller repeat protein [Microbacterium festucae]
MTDAAPAPAPRSRRWLPWTLAVFVALAVGIAAAFVVVPRLTATPAETPAASPAPSSPTPSATPSCLVTTVDTTWRDAQALDLPTDGALTATTLADVTGKYASPFAIDDTRTGVLVQGDYGTGDATLLVIDHDDAEVLWSAEVPYGTAAVATPASAGLDERIVVSHSVSPAFTESALTMYDLATGEAVAERTLPGDWAGGIHPGGGLTASALIAPADPSGFAVTTRDAATYLDAATLEPRWSVTGEQFDVGWFEGGVPFDLAADSLFVRGNAVLLESGEPRGWTVDGSVFVAAGHVLTTPIVYDSLEPYALSGIDTRTGEACWSHQVISAASDDEAVWIVTADGLLQRISPSDGAVVDDRGQVGDVGVHLLPGALVVTPRVHDIADAIYTTVHPPTGAPWTLAGYSGAPLRTSNGQIIMMEWGSVTSPGVATAYDIATGETAWNLETDPVDRTSSTMLEAGVALRTTDLGGGRFRLELLR